MHLTQSDLMSENRLVDQIMKQASWLVALTLPRTSDHQAFTAVQVPHVAVMPTLPRALPSTLPRSNLPRDPDVDADDEATGRVNVMSSNVMSSNVMSSNGSSSSPSTSNGVDRHNDD